jgi:hypothetical protein
VDAFNLYAFIAIIMNVASIGTAWAGKSLLGFSEIAPHCDRPWLATSFSEFWSRWVLEELDRHALARPDSHSLPLAPTRSHALRLFIRSPGAGTPTLARRSGTSFTIQ